MRVTRNMLARSGRLAVPSNQIGLHRLNVPRLAFAAVCLGEPFGDLLLEVVLAERLCLALINEQVDAVRGGVLDVGEAISGGHGGNLGGSDRREVVGAHIYVNFSMICDAESITECSIGVGVASHKARGSAGAAASRWDARRKA